MERAEIAVIGAGILGLATARQLLLRHPDLRVVVLDKEDRVAAHQTGHNSGVLHAGLYYAPGSLEARLCHEGKVAIERFAEEHGIPVERCGKLVVAVEDAELGRFDALHERAIANGVDGIEVLGRADIRDHEPQVIGKRALWSAETGIVDFGRLAQAMADDVLSAGGRILLSRPVHGVTRGSREIVLETPPGPVVADHVVACAGLHADTIARQCGDASPERIVPFRGDYYTLVGQARSLVVGLIYPVPDPGSRSSACT